MKENVTQEQTIAYVKENVKINNKSVIAETNGTKFVVIQSESIMVNNLLNNLTLSYGVTDYGVNVLQYMKSIQMNNDELLNNVRKALLNYYNCVSNNSIYTPN